MGFILGGDPQPAGHRLAGWLLADFRQNQAAGKVSHFQEPGAQIAGTCRSYFKGREPIYLIDLSRANIPPPRANFPGRFCDASQFTSYDGTEVPIYLIWKRRLANSPLTCRAEPVYLLGSTSQRCSWRSKRNAAFTDLVSVRMHVGVKRGSS
jgi:hypothetical protein